MIKFVIADYTYLSVEALSITQLYQSGNCLPSIAGEIILLILTSQ